MLKSIAEFIEKLEREIGNGAKVRLGIISDYALEIRVDWIDDDKHCIQRVSLTYLQNLRNLSEDLVYERAVSEIKHTYKKLME